MLQNFLLISNFIEISIKFYTNLNKQTRFTIYCLFKIADSTKTNNVEVRIENGKQFWISCLRDEIPE